jgi:ribose transport system ATP-binding protein
VSEYFLRLKGICKKFPGVSALTDVSLDIKLGEIHALCGENGAGKSTFIKIVTGVYQYSDGEMILEDKVVHFNNTKESFALGITAIYQELSMAPNMTVTENIFLGRELYRGFGLLDYSKMNTLAKKALLELGIDIDVTKPVSNYTMGYQQMIEIARALIANTKLIIMDEPTSSLSNREVDILLENIKKLKEKGIAIIYISHRLEEVFAIADRITVIRDGFKIATLEKEAADEDELIKLMVGRSLEEKFPKNQTVRGDIALKVKNLNIEGLLHDISFELYKGEVIGFAGLVGSGRTELARAIFGADKIDGGIIEILGKEVKISSPKDAIKNGMAFLTEDRKNQGLILMHDIILNATLTGLNQFYKFGFFIDQKKLNAEVDKMIEDLQIHPNIPTMMTRLLSGGNQQKVVIAKWLCSQAKIFIFDEPTRGIDVGAKVEVYNLINRLVDEGAGVIVISSELPEVMGISDRIMVMNAGHITAELSYLEATPEKILRAATGGISNEYRAN